MICTCSNCHHSYWRYRRSHPPSGVCSLLCQEVAATERQQRHAGEESAGPGIPAAIRELIRSHLDIVHNRNVPDVPDADNDWFDCAECERLEAQLTAAIAWYMPPPANVSLEGGRQLEDAAKRRVAEFYGDRGAAT